MQWQKPGDHPAVIQLPDQQPNEVPLYGVIHHGNFFRCIYPGDYVVEWGDGQVVSCSREGFESQFTEVVDA